MTREIIADYAGRLSLIPVLLHKHINPIPTTTPIQRFFIHLLRRQTILLQDFASVLTNHKTGQDSTAFILARCLLDDFITVLYLEISGFTEEDINRHSGQAFRNRFDAIREDQAINEKYYDDRNPDMMNKETYEQYWTQFKNEPNHQVYFKKDGKNSMSDTLKSFPKPSAIMRELPNTQVGRANARAFTLWKFFSNHIHYSIMTHFFDRDPKAVAMEIDMLGDSLCFVVKTMGAGSDGLNQYGIPNELEDPTNVIALIRQDHVD